MYLISSSKLRKARQQLNNVQPYFLKISSTIADILHHSPEIEHIYFDKRPEVKRRKSGYIVITGDKGLAGAYNHNVLRLAEKHLAQEDDPTLFLIGQMGRAYFAERDIRVDGEFMFTVQDPTICPCAGHCGYFHPSVPRRSAGRRVRCLHRNGNAYAA